LEGREAGGLGFLRREAGYYGGLQGPVKRLRRGADSASSSGALAAIEPPRAVLVPSALSCFGHEAASSPP
jgi:hypothetical protein